MTKINTKGGKQFGFFFILNKIIQNKDQRIVFLTAIEEQFQHFDTMNIFIHAVKCYDMN